MTEAELCACCPKQEGMENCTWNKSCELSKSAQFFFLRYLDCFPNLVSQRIIGHSFGKGTESTVSSVKQMEGSRRRQNIRMAILVSNLLQ